MKWLTMIMVAGLISAGCASTSISRALNRDNLNKLKVDMTIAQAREVMGKPAKTESSQMRDVWYYDTGLRRDEQGVHYQTFTPLFFEDGRLIKWDKPETLDLHLE